MLKRGNTTKLINHTFLKESSIQEYLKENKKIAKSLYVLLSAEEENLFQKKETLESFQNSTTENYPSIIKAFLKDAIASSEQIITALLDVYNSNELQGVLQSPLVLAGHNIEIEENRLISKTIQKEYIKYFEKICEGYTELIPLTEELDIKLFLKKAIAEKLHPCLLKTELSDFLNQIIEEENHDTPLNAIESAKNILAQKGGTFHFLYHAANLYEEKIIEKKSMVYPLDNGVGDEYVLRKGGALLKKSSEIHYTSDVNFEMEYYLTKAIIESLTKDTLLNFMSIAKDYLSRDKFILSLKVGRKDIRSNHPFILETKAKKDFQESIHNLYSSYGDAKEIITAIKLKYKEKSFAFTQWEKTLDKTKILYKTKKEENTFLTAEEMFSVMKESAIDIARDIFLRNKKDEEDLFLSIIKEEFYIHQKIKQILDDVFSETIIKEGEGWQEELHHDRATFHSTMIDSYVIDFREGKERRLNDKALALAKESDVFKMLLNIMKEHPYHNYYELDKNIFSSRSNIEIQDLITFMKNSKDIASLCRKKCGLKFRKLGQYRATGIYFEHSKTMGIDYTKGVGSYIHELAHHIDLGQYHQERQTMVSLLYQYFNPIIQKKRNYYLSDEELIARGAEIGMILLSANYEKLKESYSGPRLVEKLKEHFTASKKSYYMHEWDEYFPSSIYVDVPELIYRGEYDLLSMINEYYKVYWMGHKGDYKEIKEAYTVYDYNIDKKYPASHHSYNYYLTSIYDIEIPKVEDEKYLRELVYGVF